LVTAVPAMAVVHEDVHQRTRQQQQQWQRAKKVGAVFAQQEVRRDGTHDEQADGIA
jgi:hypothetical protein